MVATEKCQPELGSRGKVSSKPHQQKFFEKEALI